MTYIKGGILSAKQLNELSTSGNGGGPSVMIVTLSNGEWDESLNNYNTISDKSFGEIYNHITSGGIAMAFKDGVSPMILYANESVDDMSDPIYVIEGGCINKLGANYVIFEYVSMKSHSIDGDNPIIEYRIKNTSIS